MSMIDLKLEVVVLPVADADRSKEFYAGLGWRLDDDFSFDNGLRRAAAAHGEHEKRLGKADPDWPDWYAAFIVAEQAGTTLPS